MDTSTFQNDIISLDSRDDVLTLLVHLGYLAWQKHEDCVNQLLNASEILARDTYLMGAEDREKMLR